MNKEKEFNQLKKELASFKICNDSAIPETEDDGSDVETSCITNIPSCSNQRNTEHPFNRQISIQTTSSDSQDSKWDSESEKNLSYLQLENLDLKNDSNPSKSSNKNCQKPQIQKRKLMWWKVGKKKKHQINTRVNPITEYVYSALELMPESTQRKSKIFKLLSFAWFPKSLKWRIIILSLFLSILIILLVFFFCVRITNSK